MRRVINLCKQVPLLPITILAAIPLAMLGTWRPWGTRSVFAMLFGWDSVNPGVGQWLVVGRHRHRLDARRSGVLGRLGRGADDLFR